MKWATKRFIGNCFEVIGIAGISYVNYDLLHNVPMEIQVASDKVIAQLALYGVHLYQLVGASIWYFAGNYIKDSALVQRINEGEHKKDELRGN